MTIQERRIWQHAAGDTNRNYVDICIERGVILNGPGHLGAWPGCTDALRAEGWSAKKLSDLRRFSEEMQSGDLVVLRLGTSTVPAVGVIEGEYEWSDAFGDVDGWMLQHVRRVRWLWKDQLSPKVFDTYAMKLGDTTQRLSSGSVMDWVESLPNQDLVSREPLPPLPTHSVEGDLHYNAISEFLFDWGVASSSITTLMAEIGELTRIAKWYQRFGRPSEHETVAYLVVPLLRALGWTPQRMAVEWHRLDIALFESLPRSDDTLQIVVEVKKMDRSCLSAKLQAVGYAEVRGGCQRLILTDGLRYGVYTRDDGNFRLFAYLNLTRLRHKNPAYSCHGAEEALLAMSPEWKQGLQMIVPVRTEPLEAP